MEALERIAEMRRELSNMIADVASDKGSSIDGLSDTLYMLREFKRDIAILDGEIENALIAAMDENIVILQSGQQVERKTGADRKAWDHKGLATVVANRIYESSIDMDTGEVLLSPLEMMEKMLDYAAPSYWRVGELGKIGISADQYCEKSDGKTSIVISKK